GRLYVDDAHQFSSRDHWHGKFGAHRVDRTQVTRVAADVANQDGLLGASGRSCDALIQLHDKIADHLLAVPNRIPDLQSALALALAPIRVAPAATIFFTSSRVRMPPEAFTPIAGPTVSRIKATSCSVAPDGPNPVDVFTKSAPASLASRQAVRFWWLSSRAV